MDPFTPGGIVKSTPNDEHCPIFSPVDPAGEDWELEHGLRNFSVDREFEVVLRGTKVHHGDHLASTQFDLSRLSPECSTFESLTERIEGG